MKLFSSKKIDGSLKYSLYTAYLSYVGVFAYRFSTLKTPQVMQIQTVTGCNARCRLCPMPRTKRWRYADTMELAA